MSVIIRLQGLPWTASAGDIRQFFAGLNIPDGGVHIVGGEQGDAFIAFTSDEDARLAMQHNNRYLQESPVHLFLSSKTEMQHVISEARDGHTVKPVAPPRPNVPTPGGRPNLPRHMEDFPRQDMVERGRDNQRRPPNMPPFGPRGPRDELRFPTEIGGRGMRGEARSPQDIPPVNLRGNRDDPRHPLDPPVGPRGSRDNARLSPNVLSSGPRGQRDDYRQNFTPTHREFIEEPRQGGPPPRRPTDPHFRDSQVPDDRMEPQPGLPMYRDGHRPQSDFPGPSSRPFRDEHRQGHDRHRPGDQRELRQPVIDRHPTDSPYPIPEGQRDSQRRPPGQPRFDPNAPDQRFDPNRPNQRLDPNAPGPRYDPNLPRFRDFREEGRLGPPIPADGARDLRGEGPREMQSDPSRELRIEYQGDRRGPDGQLPRGMRESDRRMTQGSGTREGRNLPPPGVRPGSDPSELHVLNRRGYRDEEHFHSDRNSSEPPPHLSSLRGGQRPPLDAPEQVPHDYRDQDRRGNPPPRLFGEDGRPLPDRRRPDMQGPGQRPQAPRDRVPPGRTSQAGGFPQDHDARIPHRYDERPERQFAEYAESYAEKDRQFDDGQPYNDVYGVDQGRPLLDWDGRPPVNSSLSPQVGSLSDRSRDRPRDQSGQRPYEQTDSSRFPPRPSGRTLLPDPDVPRMGPVVFEERQDDHFHSSMESRDGYDARHGEGHFDAGYEDAYPGQAEMTDHHRNHREPYPPRGRPPGPPPGRHMPPRPAKSPINPQEMFVQVTNLPLSVTYSSLRRFFERSMIPRDGVKLLNDNQGNRIGSGYLKFVNSIGLENALIMNGKFMEGRPVGVTRCSQEEFDGATDSYTPLSRALSPKRQFSDRGYPDGEVPSPKRKRSESPSGRRSGQSRKSRNIALMRDVPYRATPQDLKLFFNQLEIVENGILFDRDSSGKPNGIAFVEFKNSKDFNLALQRNHSRFMNRSVIISVGDVKDYERALDKKRRSGGSNGTRMVNAESGENKTSKTEKSTDKEEATTPKKESPQKTVTTSSVNISCFCVRLKGLPPTVTKKNVEDFFKGLDIAPKGYFPVSRKDGSCTGDAFVEFVSPKECQKACAKDQELMGNRTISVQPVSKAAMTKDLQELRKKAAEESPVPVQPQRPPPLYFMLGAQNLPFSVSIGEILNFFRGYNPVPESIRLHYTNEGRPTGDAVIGFMTESECHRALRDLNARMLGRRNIRLYLA
ncbi:filaggrin-2-like isoform X2 [Liolophura sinensis]